MEWYLEVLRKYATFSGRAARREFWFFQLWNLVASIALFIVDALLGTDTPELAYGLLGTLYGLGVLVPSLAVGARRLHDIGRTGWWQLIMLIPLLGLILLIVWWATEGEGGPNRFGPEPGPEPGTVQPTW